MTDASSEEISFASVGRSAAMLTGAALVVQIVGIGRELFVASKVGLSSDYDALLVGLALPSGLASLLTIGATTALVPAFINIRKYRSVEDARRFAGSVLLWLGIAGFALTLALFAFAGIAVALTGPGLDAASKEMATGYARVLAPTIFLTVISGVFSSICQAEQRFSTIALAALVSSCTGLILVVALWGTAGLWSLVVANLAVPTVIIVILLASLIRGSLVPRLTLRPAGSDMRSFVRHAAPLTLAAAIGQLQLITDRAIASLLGPGAISALRYGEVLVRTPVSAVQSAWSSALYPALVRAGIDRASQGLASATERSIRYMLVLFIPVASLTAAVAPVAVEVAFGRGAFSPADVAETARVVAAFAPLIVIWMVSPVLVGAHNARRHGRVLLIGATGNAIINLVLDVLFGAWLGAPGVALASSVVSVLVVLYFARRLAQSEPGFHPRGLGRTAVVATLTSIPPALVVAAFAWGGPANVGLVPGLAQLLVSGICGIVAYIGISTFVRFDEPRILAAAALSGIARRLRTSTRN